RDEVEVQSGRVVESIRRAGALEASDEPLTGAVADEAFQTLRHAFDPRWGGFGGAPKFPQPMTLEFVLRQAIREVPDALEMVVLTLDRMAGSGRWDEARSRLFEAREARVRPAVDDKILTAWNALAIRAFAEAGRIFGDRTYVEAAVGCAAFVWDHLRDEDGRLLRSWREGV